MATAEIDYSLESDPTRKNEVKAVQAIASQLGSRFNVTYDNKQGEALLSETTQKEKTFAGITPKRSYVHTPTLAIQYITPLDGKLGQLADEEISYALNKLALKLSAATGEEFKAGKSYVLAEIPPSAIAATLDKIKSSSRTISAAVGNYERTITEKANNPSASHVEKSQLSLSRKSLLIG